MPSQDILHEVQSWHFETQAPAFTLLNPKSKFALLMIMAGDDKALSGQIMPDIHEMMMGVQGGEEITVLALADQPGLPSSKTVIFELTNQKPRQIPQAYSIDTGDPRPIADFLTRAFQSFDPSTKIAIGFWGHGSGVLGDLDPQENLIPNQLRSLPLGTPITNDMFLEHFTPEPIPLKPLISRAMLPDMTSGNILTNRELSSALTAAFSRSGRKEPVDMIFFDTCLNGSVEVFAELRRYSHTFIGSPLVIPGEGWNYTAFLQRTRRHKPNTAQEWAKLAIAAFDHEYEQDYYPSPVQLVAINCKTEALSKLKDIVEQLLALGQEEASQNIFKACRVLKKVGHDESVDLVQFIYALRQVVKESKIKDACDQFINTYGASIVALSGPSNDGRNYTGLTVWLPLAGDRSGVSQYYQKFQFHQDSHWHRIVQFFLEEQEPTKQTVMPVVAIGFLNVKQVPGQPDGVFQLVSNDETGGQNLHFVIPPGSEPWTDDLQSGIYSVEEISTVTFMSREDFAEFVQKLISLRRRQHEFILLEYASQNKVAVGPKAIGALFYQLNKYRMIIFDEHPELFEPYEALFQLTSKAKDKGILFLGD